VLVMTAWDEFRSLTPADFARPGARPILIDCWRLYQGKGFDTTCTYLTLGAGNRRAQTGLSASGAAQSAREHAAG